MTDFASWKPAAAPTRRFQLVQPDGTVSYYGWETGGTRFLLLRSGSNAVLVTSPTRCSRARCASSRSRSAPRARLQQVIVAPALFTGSWEVDRVRAQLIVSSSSAPNLDFYDLSAWWPESLVRQDRQTLAWLPAKPAATSSRQ